MDNARFTFEGYEFDLKNGTASFRYSIEGAEKHEFREKISFPRVQSDISSDLLNNIFEGISLILGINYWKLFAPQNISLKTFTLSKNQADFWNTVYTKGLGEFFYKNKIDFRGLINFPHNGKNKSSVSFPRKSRSFVLIGGGRDSIVTAEAFKKENKPFDVLIVGDYLIPKKVASIMGKIPIVIKRELDPKIFALNKQKDVYNGHVPVSAYYAFMGLLAAVLYDYRYLVVSNEESANYGNVEYLGTIVNHQWSKSLEFENLFRDYVSSFISPDLVYFSLLRPLREIKITEVFTRYPEYFNSFSSCNRNFRINKEQSKKWCGQCPKCLFVFTALSAFISKEKLLSIFGQNLYEDNNLLPFFKELLGISKIKPFECVGTPEEMQYALYLASKKEEFSESFLMKFFEKEILPSINPMQLSKVMQVNLKENIPSEFKDIFNEI